MSKEKGKPEKPSKPETITRPNPPPDREEKGHKEQLETSKRNIKK